MTINGIPRLYLDPGDGPTKREADTLPDTTTTDPVFVLSRRRRRSFVMAPMSTWQLVRRWIARRLLRLAWRIAP